MTCLFRFSLVWDLGFEMMPKAKATKTSNIQAVLQDFLEEFLKSPNDKLYCNMCIRMVL